MGLLGKIFGGIAGALLGPIVGGVLGLGGKKKAPKAIAPIASRDDARAIADRDLALARRRGAAADIISGAGGEPAAGTIGRLVVGS